SPVARDPVKLRSCGPLELKGEDWLIEGESSVNPSNVDELKLVNNTPLPGAFAGSVILRWKSENADVVLLVIDSITSYAPPLPTECATVKVSVMGLMLSKTLEKSSPLSLVELASTENDPSPAPLAVMSVMTADAVAVEIDPPKIKAARVNLDRLFIFFSVLGRLFIFFPEDGFSRLTDALRDIFSAYPVND